jgi:hypothetical protein
VDVEQALRAHFEILGDLTDDEFDELGGIALIDAMDVDAVGPIDGAHQVDVGPVQRPAVASQYCFDVASRDQLV